MGKNAAGAGLEIGDGLKDAHLFWKAVSMQSVVNFVALATRSPKVLRTADAPEDWRGKAALDC